MSTLNRHLNHERRSKMLKPWKH